MRKRFYIELNVPAEVTTEKLAEEIRLALLEGLWLSHNMAVRCIETSTITVHYIKDAPARKRA